MAAQVSMSLGWQQRLYFILTPQNEMFVCADGPAAEKQRNNV